MLRVKVIYLIASLLLLSGCTSVENFGNSVLDTVGYVPGKTSFDPTESIVKAAKTLNREEEYYLGRAVSAHILNQYKPYQNAALRAYVNKIGAVVVAASDQPETFGGYHFLVLDSAEVNAMSAPGGFIFITRGMLDLMPDEDTLATVLAHEVAHVTEGHGVAAISQANLTKALISVGALAGSLNCAEVVQQATVVFGGAVEDVVETLVAKGYSREQEYEADQAALIILTRSGYDPQALETMLMQLQANQLGGKGGWFDTHPETADRLAEIQGALKRAVAKSSVQGRFERSQRFHKIVRS